MHVTETKFPPGSDIPPNRNDTSAERNDSSSEFVYYRVYHNYGIIATKRPAYLNDIYIGRIRSKWVTPPHTAGSLKRCLCSMENIDPKTTKLFASGSNQSALADEAPISLKINQPEALGIIPEDPVIILSKAMPQTGMEPGTESFYIEPDSDSPLASRFLFYGVYTETRAQASKDPIDAEQPWLSKIDLYSILPPVSVTSLLYILNMKEGINTSPQLLVQDRPISHDQTIFTKDGKSWLGASAEDHVVLKFGRPPFAEESQYRIQNVCTGNSLAFKARSFFYTNIDIYAPGHDDGPWKHFTLGLLDDGSVAIRNVPSGRWIAPSCCTSKRERGSWLIPSMTSKNSFFICEGDPVSSKAFYDPGASDEAQCHRLESRELDTTDRRQMWSLIPAVQFPSGKTASSGPEFVYYRVYHNYGAIATKRPAYLNDKYLGRIRAKWVTVPHTAGSLKLCLSSMENINPDKTKLLASVLNQSALVDETPIWLTSNQTLGVTPEDPVILFSSAIPQAGMQRWTTSFRVAPDSESPLAPRFLFYGVYTEAGTQASKAPIHPGQSWLSKIDLYSILPPVSVTSLLYILNMKEGINTSPQLLAQDGLTPLGDDQIFTKDGDWLGASAEDHLVLKFGRSPFAEGIQYRIQNCCTRNSLACSVLGTKIEVYPPGYFDGPWKHFTLRLHDDGSVAFRNVHYEDWIAPNCCTSKTKHGFCLVPSTTNKNSFFICERDPVCGKAFYDDVGASHGARYSTLESRELDTTDTRQMWSLIPAVVFS